MAANPAIYIVDVCREMSTLVHLETSFLEFTFDSSRAREEGSLSLVSAQPTTAPPDPASVSYSYISSFSELASITQSLGRALSRNLRLKKVGNYRALTFGYGNASGGFQSALR